MMHKLEKKNNFHDLKTLTFCIKIYFIVTSQDVEEFFPHFVSGDIAPFLRFP